MVVIPFGIDAPIYHYPITTIGLIVANFVCFAATGYGSEELVGDWVLKFGEINPLQWLTSMFSHAGFTHIFGNMIFLWSFGLIVEGKIGWKRMLLVYMSIGLSQAALIQLIMLPVGQGGALGASSAIYGLMAMCMIWAPKNELKVFFWFFIRVFIFEVTIMYFALFFIGWDLVSLLVIDRGMSTAALHTSGAMIGLGVGALMVKKKWVDCEGWDLFNVMAGTYGRNSDKYTAIGSHADASIVFGKSDVAVKDDIKTESRSARGSRRVREICSTIDRADFISASEQMLELRMQHDSELPEGHLKRLATGLLRANVPDDAEIYLEEYVERFPEEASWARVRLAQLLLTVHRRPRAALAMLKRVRLSRLTAELTSLAKKLAIEARKQVKAGVEDAEPEW